MSGFGTTFMKSVNEAVFRGGSLPTLTTLYISLHTGSPGVDGQTANEVSGGSYARVAKTSDTTNWGAATNADPSVIANATAITFPTATGSWGTVSHFGIWNHASNTAAANFVAATALTASQAIASTNTASFAVGALTHSLDSV